jgi:hypothetical protein
MNDHKQDKPPEPQESEQTLRDRRRILEELTPNVSAKQLTEQLARMRRDGDLASDDEADDARPPEVGGAKPADQDDPQQHRTSDAEPGPQAATPASDENPAPSAPLHLEEPRLSTLETRAVIITSEPMPESRVETPITDTRPGTPVADVSGSPAPSPNEAQIPLKPETPETPAETAVLTGDKPVTTKSDTYQLPSIKRKALENGGAQPSQPGEVSSAGDNAPLSAAGPKNGAPAPGESPSPDANAGDGKPARNPLETKTDSLMPPETGEPDAPAVALDDEMSKKHDTAVLANKPQVRRALQQTAPDEHQTASLGENREIILVIRGMVERLVLPEDKRIILGRTDVKSRFLPDVDLTPYGALDRGVSREHASLHLQGDRLYVTDLNSTNGTYLAGKKLDPNTPSVLRKGDELLLGRLPVQVLFR